MTQIFADFVFTAIDEENFRKERKYFYSLRTLRNPFAALRFRK